MNSIQSHLTRRLIVATIVLSALSGGALFIILNRAMTKEFDRSLGVRTHSLQSLVTQDASGKLDVDVFVQSLPEFSKATPPEFFAIVDADGKAVLSSSKQSLIPGNSDGPEHWDATLPTGEPARAMRLTFMPPLDVEEAEEPKSKTRDAMAEKFLLPLTLTVARDRRPLTTLQIRVAAAIALSTALFSMFTVVAAVWIVRRGLGSLRSVAADAASIDFRDPNARFASATIPSELEPIVQKLNDLLRRVADAFGRERQFTAAVSHELRTPIAELRSAAEIALRDRKNADLSQRAVNQARDIAVQMQTIVSTLLSIASSDRAVEPARLVPVFLLDAVEQAATRHRTQMSVRCISLELKIDSMLEIFADAALLSGVLENLIGNASQYAAAQSTSSIAASVRGDIVRLTIDNAVENFVAADTAHMFDAFWRKDSARSANEHVGLGLTLTKAYCNAMRTPISAAMKQPGRLAISIDFQIVRPLPQLDRDARSVPAMGGVK